MLGKHPLELPPPRKLSKEELAEALRLSIIAELDAVNLYLQLARYSEDENARKLFEDIAKEEKTHVGEFLAMLQSLDPEQVAELKAGAQEVRKLTGVSAPEGDPPKEEALSEDSVLKNLGAKVKEVVESTRRLRKVLNVVYVGRGVEGVLLEGTSVEETEVIKPRASRVVRLNELSTQFSLKVRTLDYWSRTNIQPDLSSLVLASTKLALAEDKAILEGDLERGWPGLLTCGMSVKEELSDWAVPGNPVADVSKAVRRLVNEAIPPPYMLLVSPARYADLLRYTEKAGVMELQRVKALVDDVVQTPLLDDDNVLIISTNKHVIDLVVGADTILDYLGPSGDEHLYRLWETLALRIKNPKAIVHLVKR
ncbi:MAG: family 1 encapsulin nanocompartment shell protein [Zestosphaera sp.]